ncbi:tRNA (adenosine(37)-N6)-threonylcarbamoyltransferase complex dimerization subunit type 1 TsaB [Brachybacterium endophyticum]|uniref:tRNA (Adenosine(37)-N6)-threonylcarbamoyltransferase complex dimerization subunit type 1 TsaB n=2 Tax=Brachybacterium endophyticum TaxID=2182385 RepID=A0A2U2RQ30_9MICO|nr:tRNA (adenosine(37)-N6)-threonylcarbamoyltransferase complex dimerization subunit type 1 TsaB [Brachybacterium endophyticum]
MWLGIDTSGAVGVAVGDRESGEVLAAHQDERARHHDEVLMELIDRCLREAGGQRSDLEAVVAGRGPGPFTGLRVGLVTAREIAFVLDLPLYGLCSLDALALQAASEAPSARDLVVALDARRREVYWARYSRDAGDDSGEPATTPAAEAPLTRVAGPTVSAPADIAEGITAADVVAGSGALLHAEQLRPTSALAHADPGFLLREAWRALDAGQDLTSTEPLYLREPDAKKPTARKSALGRA